MQLVCPLVCGQAIGLYPPQYPALPPVPTADSAIEACRITKCNAMAAIPTFIEVMYISDTSVSFTYLASSIGHNLTNT